jgi:hypothetical protein
VSRRPGAAIERLPGDCDADLSTGRELLYTSWRFEALTPLGPGPVRESDVVSPSRPRTKSR